MWLLLVTYHLQAVADAAKADEARQQCEWLECEIAKQTAL